MLHPKQTCFARQLEPTTLKVLIIPTVAENFIFVFSDGDADAIEIVMISQRIDIKPRDDQEADDGSNSFVWPGLALLVPFASS